MQLKDFLNEVEDLVRVSDRLNDGWKLESCGDHKYATKTETRVIAKLKDCVCFVRWEYHVIYSPSYQSPVLYFNAWHPNGQLLSLDEVISTVVACFRDEISRNKWSALTQQEHPFLRVPFYYLHPCKTKDLPNFGGSGFLVTWLSTVGPVVGLKVSEFYSKWRVK